MRRPGKPPTLQLPPLDKGGRRRWLIDNALDSPHDMFPWQSSLPVSSQFSGMPESVVPNACMHLCRLTLSEGAFLMENIRKDSRSVSAQGKSADCVLFPIDFPMPYMIDLNHSHFNVLNQLHNRW